VLVLPFALVGPCLLWHPGHLLVMLWERCSLHRLVRCASGSPRTAHSGITSRDADAMSLTGLTA